MLKTVEETIDGIDFKTVQFGAVAGFTLLAKLTKVAGPVIAGLGGMKEGEDDLELFRIISVAVSSMPAEEFTALALEVLKSTTAIIVDERAGGRRAVDLNSRENVDRVFNGRVMTMIKVLAHALKANYADFIGGSDLLAPMMNEPKEL